MRKLILLANLLLLSVFASAQVDSSSVFIYGWIENLGGASVEVNVALSDGQSTTVLAQNGFYSAVFLSPGDFGVATSSLIDCNGNEVSGTADYQLFDAVQINLLYCANAIVFGCTDPQATNYNAEATDDDGSCEYPIECDENLVTFTMNTSAWGEEIFWTINDADSSWFGNYESYSSYTHQLCLPDGCYILGLYDSFGDGWNGAVLTAEVNGLISTYSLAGGSSDAFMLNINSGDCEEILYGCTDPIAVNYDSSAVIDDGSCDYCDGIDALLYVCTYANGGNVGIQITGNGEVVFEQYGFGNNIIEYIELCLQEGVCYTVNMSNSEETGWYGGYYWITSNGDQLSTEELDFNLSLESTTFGIGDACPTEGCTNPDAINYNPAADIDDGSCIVPGECDNNFLMVEATAQGFPSEMSWYIVTPANDTLMVGGPYEVSGESVLTYACIEDGCYSLVMLDSFGDGWNGGTINISLNGELVLATTLAQGSSQMEIIAVNSDCAEPVLGCTDPNALNYNSEATDDDGSCEYPLECDDNLVTFTMTTAIWAEEIYWSISDPDSSWFGGYVDNSVSQNQLCLGDGCYTITMYDSFGDGWNGGVLTVEVNGTTYTTSLNSGTIGTFTFGINTYGCEEPLNGCTDPTALNYDPEATIDDGSCQYSNGCECTQVYDPVCAWVYDGFFQDSVLVTFTNECWALCEGAVIEYSGTCEDLDVYGCTDPEAENYNPFATIDDGSCNYCENISATLYVCTFSNGGNVGIQITGNGEVVYEQYGFSDNIIAYIDLCLEEGVCYTVNMSNSQGTGWYNGYYWINANGVQLSTDELDTNLSFESTTFGIGDACPTEGCTDSDALNYDPSADIDDGSCIVPEDCENNFIYVESTAQSFPGEMSWYIVDPNNDTLMVGGPFQASGETQIGFACIEDGCYSLVILDSFGDGWNGGTININVNGEEVLATTLASGSSGFETIAVNSDCDELTGGCTDPAAINYDPNADYDDGSCAYDNGCECTEVYDPVCAWTYNVFLQDSVLTTFTNECWALCEGAVIEYYGACGSDEVLGCTDPNALNYDPLANTNDGSCIYESDCNDNLVSFTMSTAIWAEEIYWSISDPDSSWFGGYQNNEIQTDFLCLEDGCYTITMYDSFGDGWNGAVMMVEVNGESYTVELGSGSTGTFTFGINTDGCVEDVILGCTDIAALNYNPLATEDDGSCFYYNPDSLFCDATFIAIADSLANTIWVFTEQYNSNWDYLWDFGDGSTSDLPFPIYTYSGDGPYQLCLTVSLPPAGGVDSCTSTYCDSVGVFLFPGFTAGGFESVQSGFTINVVQGTNDIPVQESLSGLEVYPNPGNGNYQIQFSTANSEKVVMNVFDLNGKLVSSDTWTTSRGVVNRPLDLSDLESGIYILSLTESQSQIQKRLIKL